MTTQSASANFADEDRTQAVARLRILFWTLALSVPVWAGVGVLGLHEGPARALAVSASIEAIVLFCGLLARAGRVGWASLMLVAATWLLLTALAYTGGGPAGRVAWGYFIVVLVAGVTLGSQAAIAAAVVCMLTVLGLALAAMAGALPPSAIPSEPLNLWLVNSLFLSIAAGVQYLNNRFTQASLQRARDELAERRRTEQRLRDSEARFRAVFEHAAIGVALNDLSGHPIATNAAEQAFLGYSGPELARMTFAQFTHPDDVANDLLLYEELIAGRRESYQIEKRYRRQDGAEVWGHLTVSLVRDAAGAPQFAIAMTEDITESKRAEAALRQYAARMQTLHKIDRAILAAQSVDETARAALRDVRALVSCARAAIFLVEAAAEEGTLFVSASDDGSAEGRVVVESRRFDLETAYGQQVLEPLRRGQPVAIDDVLALDATDPAMEGARRLGLRSWLHLSLQAGQGWYGTLNLARAEPGPFGPADRDIAQEVADQLAIAIRQARLLAETTEALQREQRQNEVARTISGTLDWRTVVKTLMRLAAEALGASGSLTGLLNADDLLTFFPSFFTASGAPAASLPDDGLEHHSVRRGEGLVWQLIETRRPMLLDDYGAQPGALPYLVQAGAHAVVAVPIIAGDTVLGGLAVFDTDPKRRFTLRDQAMLEAIASQAGLAIQNARLFEAEQSARASADVLLESARAISSTLSLPEVLQRILAQASRVVPAVTGALSTQTGDGAGLNVTALLGYDDRQAAVTRVLREQAARTPLMQRMHQQPEPVLISDVQADPDWVTFPEFAHIRAVMAVPILGRDQTTVGVLSLDSDQPGAFTPRHLQTVRVLASQAAIAIENASLFEATRRQLSELVVLHAGALAATEASDEDTLITRATQIISQGLFSTFCGVSLVEAARRVVRPHPSLMGPGPIETALVDVPLGQGVAGTVALSGQPWRIPDVRLEPRYLPPVPGMLSELCVPLKAGERIIGVINVESDRLEAFSADDERLLVTYAGLLATAIVRLRAEAESRALTQHLEQRVAARTRELSALYDVSEFASQLLDLPTIIARSLARVLEAVNAHSGAVFLLAEPGLAASDRLLGLTVQQGLPPELVAQIERSAGDGLIGQAVSQGQPVVWPQPLAGGLICVGLPMNVGGTPVGVLGAFREAGQSFNVEELALLASAADGLAVSIENVRLRQHAEETAVAVERERLARDLHDSVTQGLYSLTLFAEAGRRLVRTPAAADKLEQYLIRLGETSRQALKDMRLLIHNLRPAEFAPEDLVGALQHRLDAVERRSGVEASLTVEGAAELPPAAAEALYKIAQEALNNALKHSNGSAVRVRLYNENGHTSLEIADNGKGFESSAATGGMGLSNMQARAQQVGGTFEIRSVLGAGTTVTVTVPGGGVAVA